MSSKGQVGLPYISKLDSESNSSPDAGDSDDDDDDGDLSNEMDERGPMGLHSGLPLTSQSMNKVPGLLASVLTGLGKQSNSSQKTQKKQ